MDFADSNGQNLGIYREHGHHSRPMLGDLEQKKALELSLKIHVSSLQASKPAGMSSGGKIQPSNMKHGWRCVGLQGEESIVSILGAVSASIHSQAGIILHTFSTARLMGMN